MCKFVSKHSNSKCQVINLGAGFDTRFFRLLDHLQPKDESSTAVLWYEIDYAFVLKEKERILAKNNIAPPLPTFVPLDLNGEMASVCEALIDKTIPTLVLAECIFTYLLPERGEWLINNYFTSFPECEMVAFEIVGYNDPFGKMMISNMETHFQIEMPAVKKYPTVEASKGRFSACWMNVRALTLVDLWETWKKPEVSEFIDDVQELRLMFEHFAVFQAEHSSMHKKRHLLE